LRINRLTHPSTIHWRVPVPSSLPDQGEPIRKLLYEYR